MINDVVGDEKLSEWIENCGNRMKHFAFTLLGLVQKAIQATAVANKNQDNIQVIDLQQDATHIDISSFQECVEQYAHHRSHWTICASMQEWAMLRFEVS